MKKEETKSNKQNFMAERRQQIYDEYKNRVHKMTEDITKERNLPDFEKVIEFLKAGTGKLDIIPTCLLVNSKFLLILRKCVLQYE